MQGQADRVNYLMTKQAKIVAMTCTHAALKRREFLELGFKFDNLLMEESAQILEIETFIPMLLQVSMLAITITKCRRSRLACNALLVCCLLTGWQYHGESALLVCTSSNDWGRLRLLCSDMALISQPDMCRTRMTGSRG